MVEDYQLYLQSDQWYEKRKLILERCNSICEECKAKPAEEVHHLTYDRVGNELLEDLLGLCKDCHSKKHPDKVRYDSNHYRPVEEIAVICDVSPNQIYDLLNQLQLIKREYVWVDKYGRGHKGYWISTYKGSYYSKETKRRSYNWNVEFIQDLVKKHNIVKIKPDENSFYPIVVPKRDIYNQLISKYGLTTFFNTRKRYWEIKKE